MEFDATSEDGLELRDIPPPLGEFLRQIPSAVEVDNPDVAARFFPCPSQDPAEDSLRADWKALVEPGLYEVFLDARGVVESDVRRMIKDGGTFALTIPRRHTRAWIHALNQARIGLVTRHGIQIDESAAWPPHPIATEGDWLLLQIGFYERVLGWLVEMLED
jgi:hypothetical protein